MNVEGFSFFDYSERDKISRMNTLFSRFEALNVADDVFPCGHAVCVSPRTNTEELKLIPTISRCTRWHCCHIPPHTDTQTLAHPHTHIQSGTDWQTQHYLRLQRWTGALCLSLSLCLSLMHTISVSVVCFFSFSSSPTLSFPLSILSP